MKEECYKTELDLFNPGTLQTSIENGTWEKVDFLGKDLSNTIDFLITGTNDYVDLAETEIYIKCSIRKKSTTDEATTTPITETDEIAPVNNFLHSMFAQVTVQLNNTVVDNTNSSYPYRAYIENLLNYGNQAKLTHLRSCLFIKDDPEQFDNIKLTAAGTEKTNAGFLSRRKPCLKGSFEMQDKLHCNFVYGLGKLIPPNLSIKITLTRSDPKFCLIGKKGSDYIINIEKASLLVRRVEVSPFIQKSHLTSLQTNNIIYPIRRVIVKNVIITKDVEDVEITNIHTGVMPRRVVFGLVRHTAASGIYEKNPFNFEHFNIKSLNLSVAGHNAPYRSDLEMNFEKKNYIRGYSTLFTNLPKSVYLTGNDITYGDYPHGNCLFVFNCSPDLCDGDHFNPINRGELKLAIKFAKAVEENLAAIFYLEFDNTVEIDKNYTIIKDF